MKYLISILILILLILTFIEKYILIEPSVYKIYDEKNDLINAYTYINTKTFDGAETKELILYFPEVKKKYFLTIAIAPKIIGIPDNLNNIKVIRNKLYLPNESKIFMPISEGVEKILHSYFVSDSLIYFETFDDLKKYGSKISVRK